MANKSLLMVLGCVVLALVLAVEVVFIVRKGESRPAAPAASQVASATASAANGSAALSAPAGPQPGGSVGNGAVAPGGATSNESETAERAAAHALGFEDFSDDGEPRTEKPAPPRHFDTVQRAAIESCTTASVDGLSRQIIAQARCIRPNAFVPLPSKPNLVIASQVFPYLELQARNQLVKALEARPNQKMTINSALRTVAQQYLVWRWSATKRCGVPLATPPGESNHEIGIALDIAEAGTWRPVLEQHQFKWLGASDRVHFDFKKPGAPPPATDVLAFQTLWNRNHPTDKIAATGKYDAATEERLKQSPPDGFKLGASCGKAKQ
jgi:hypothetical protein